MTILAASRARVANQSDPVIAVSRTVGPYVFDSSGRRYIDFFTGWTVGNFGWNSRKIQHRRETSRRPDYVYPGFRYAPWDELAKRLISMAPGRLTTCFRATGGSEAVDMALQAAAIHTGRRAFVSIEGSYHGNTLGTLSIGASESRKEIPALLPRCKKIRPPLNAKALRTVRSRLKNRDVAAFVMEPIVINLGVLSPANDFMSGLRDLCRRYGTLLILDEVASGFGRTGKLFATEHFRISPDIICLGKAITGGAAGMGALLTTTTVARSMEESGAFYSSYGWHPSSVEAALGVLQFLQRSKEKLMANVNSLGELFRNRLGQMSFLRRPEIRIKGLAVGIDVGDEKYASRIESKCRKNGLLIANEGEILLMLPPLTIERTLAERALNIFARSI